MPTPNPTARLLPGASALGYAVNLATAQSFIDLSSVLLRVVKVDESAAHGHPTTRFGHDYYIPPTVELGDTTNFNTTISTFASEEEFSTHMAGETGVKAKVWGFNGEFKASYSNLTKGETQSAYGLVEGHHVLWSAHLNAWDERAPEFNRDLLALPVQFSPATQAQFFRFLNQYGTHFISSVAVGGQLNYYATVARSSHYTKETAKAQLTLEYKAAFGSTSSTSKGEWEALAKDWHASRSVRLAAIGGDNESLSKASPSDNKYDYNDVVTAWSAGLKDNPAITGVMLLPLSKLTTAQQYDALDTAIDAYLTNSITASFTVSYEDGKGTYPRITGVGCSVLLGKTQLLPPTLPGPTDYSNFWIMLADDQGNILFNRNVLSENAQQFDDLVKQAKAASLTGAYSAIVLASNVHVSLPSPTSMAWLRDCGISMASWTKEAHYPGAPFQFIAIGKTNTPSYPASSAAYDITAAHASAGGLFNIQAMVPLSIDLTSAKDAR